METSRLPSLRHVCVDFRTPHAIYIYIDQYKLKGGRYALKRGHGTHRWADGNSYTGAFSDNKRYGYGRHTWADGTSSEGAWHETCRCPSRSIPRPRIHPFERTVSHAGSAAGAYIYAV